MSQFLFELRTVRRRGRTNKTILLDRRHNLRSSLLSSSKQLPCYLFGFEFFFFFFPIIKINSLRYAGSRTPIQYKYNSSHTQASFVVLVVVLVVVVLVVVLVLEPPQGAGIPTPTLFVREIT